MLICCYTATCSSAQGSWVTGREAATMPLGPMPTPGARFLVAHKELPWPQLPGRAILVLSGAKDLRGPWAHGSFSDGTYCFPPRPLHSRCGPGQGSRFQVSAATDGHVWHMGGSWASPSSYSQSLGHLLHCHPWGPQMGLWGLSSRGSPQGTCLLDRMAIWGSSVSYKDVPRDLSGSCHWVEEPILVVGPSSLLPDPTCHPSVSHSMGCLGAPPAGYCLKSSACRIAACGRFSPVQALSPSLWGTPKCSKGLDVYREKVHSVLLMPRSKRDKINSTIYRCLLRKSEYPEKQGNDYCMYQCGRQLWEGEEGTVTAGPPRLLLCGAVSTVWSGNSLSVFTASFLC